MFEFIKQNGNGGKAGHGLLAEIEKEFGETTRQVTFLQEANEGLKQEKERLEAELRERRAKLKKMEKDNGALELDVAELRKEAEKLNEREGNGKKKKGWLSFLSKEKDLEAEVSKLRKNAEVEYVKLPGKRKASAAEVEAALSNLSFAKTGRKGDNVFLISTESQDLKGKAHLYSAFSFNPDGIEFEYSITPECNPSVRRIQACKLALGILALVKGYELEYAPLYEHAAQALSEALEIAGADYQLLKNKYTTLEEGQSELKRKSAEALGVNEKLNKLVLESEKKNVRLSERVKRLEGMSDEALLEEVFETVKAHAGSFKPGEFARSRGVTQARVEEALEKLMKEGYIRKVS